MPRGRPPQRVPNLCRRPDGRLYATDPATKKQVYFKDEMDYERWRQTYLRRRDEDKRRQAEDARRRLYADDPATGERVYFRDEAEYERWVQGFRRGQAGDQTTEPPPPPRGEGKRRTPLPGSRVTVAQLCDAFLDHAETYYRKDGEPTGYLWVVQLSIRNWLGVCPREPADLMRAADAEKIQQHMIEAGYARSTINTALTCIRSILRWGVRKEWVSGDTLERFRSQPALKKGRSAAREKPKIGPVSLETIRATESQLSKTLRAMVWVQYYGGMRPGEVCRLSRGQIDRSGDVWEYLPARFKTEHHHEDEDVQAVGRRVFFGPQAQEILAPFLLRARGDDEPLFRAERAWRGRKRVYATKSYGEAIWRACRRAGVPLWSPNRLRHARATEIRRRYGIEASRVYLGHADLRTNEVYAERDFELARKVARETG